MKKRTIIILSILCLLLCVLVVAEVCYLYSGVEFHRNVPKSAASELVKSVTEEIANPAAYKTVENVVAAKVEAPKTEAQKAEAPKVEAPKTEAPKAEAPKTETPKAAKQAPRDWKVKNCGSGKMNTLRQNGDNALSLIDENGKELWHIQMTGKIADGVAQVDMFHNGKIQFLFAVGDRLHLVDRLGREVVPFPQKLPFTAANGPSECTKNGKKYWKIASKNNKSAAYADFNVSGKADILTEEPK